MSRLAAIGAIHGLLAGLGDVPRTFPSLPPEHEAEFWNMRWANRVNQTDKYRIIPVEYYHRQVYTSASTTKLNFFKGSNNNTNAMTTNLPDGKVPQDMAVWLTSFGFRPLDVSAAGAFTAIISQTDTTPVQANLQSITAVWKMLSVAEWTARIQNQQVANGFGLDLLPAGGGPDIQGLGSITSPGLVAYGNNGAPFAQAVREFSAPIALVPDRQLDIECNWPAAFTLAIGNPNLCMYVRGAAVVKYTT